MVIANLHVKYHAVKTFLGDLGDGTDHHPVKLAKTLHHTGPDRIQMDIPHQLKEIFILLAQFSTHA
jgi:hypothetical protein